MVKSNIKNEDLKAINDTKQQLLLEIDNIKQFYNQTCVVEGNTMYSTNRNYQYWLLNNNIMLDASGKLNKVYELNDIFKLQHQTPVLDHANWSFFIFKTNTCKSSKERTIDFYETVNRMLNTHGVDNTLVIGNKEDEKQIEANYKNHFGNITGSNEYKDLANCMIVHNPNLPFREYILEYLYYGEYKLDNRNKWVGQRCGSGDEQVYRFWDTLFEEYRQCKNANEIYQAIKRVNRDMEKDSKVFIFNNDTEMINRVLKMFKGNKTVKEYENHIKFEKTKQDKYNEERLENRQAMKFIKLCTEIVKLKHIDLQATKKNRKKEDIIQNGIYTKEKIREYLKISNKSNFTNKVLNDVEVIGYLSKHNIKVNTREFDFTQYIA